MPPNTSSSQSVTGVWCIPVCGPGVILSNYQGGQIIFFGSTHKVNCSSVTSPSSMAAWRSVFPSLCAFFAILGHFHTLCGDSGGNENEGIFEMFLYNRVVGFDSGCAVGGK